MMLAYIASAMQGIIRQPSAVPALPDLRNLGTILRILLAVNGATLLMALAREPRLPALATEWATLTGFVEPHLFAELAVLWLVAPLHRAARASKRDRDRHDHHLRDRVRRRCAVAENDR